jgi:ATP-dependent helicase HepA
MVQRYAARIDDEDEAVRSTAIRSLKRYIAETYRLQQRLLRTRRKEIAGWELQPRSPVLTSDVDEDDRMPDACAVLEEWRVRAARSLDAYDGSGLAEEQLAARRLHLRGRYVRLFEAASGGADELAIEVRRQADAIGSGEQDSFPEDGLLIADLLTILTGPVDAMFDRAHVATGAAELAISALRSQSTDAPKIVAFASSTGLAQAVHEVLSMSRQLGRDAALLLTNEMSADGVASTVEQFRVATQPRVLICDRAGEEGLNLPFANGIIHLDLPLSPSRMEQRIGRLDRYGRTQERIRHRFILPNDDDDSPWLAWKDLLEHGFGVFAHSLSDVQFSLNDLQVAVAEALFEGGAFGLRGIRQLVADRLQEAREDLDREAELDRMELDLHEESPLYDALDRADSDEGSFIRPLTSWWHDMLALAQWRDESRPDTFYLGWGHRTLLPRRPWKATFEDGLQRKLTFRRYHAVHEPGVRLVRPGVPFLDRQQDFLRWDDRGTAFATWRQTDAWPAAEHGPWLGFKLAYIVAGDCDGAVVRAGLNPQVTPVLRRRLDGLFAPRLQVLYVDLAFQEVVDPRLLGLLELGYYTGSEAAHRDFNLGSRQEALFSVVDPGRWAKLCDRARIVSEQLLRNSREFQTQVERTVHRAEEELGELNERLRRRATAVLSETGSPDPWIAEEIQLNEAILQVAGSPHIQLDSIGFFVLTDQPPPSGDDT